jgi:hypothetical protein
MAGKRCDGCSETCRQNKSARVAHDILFYKIRYLLHNNAIAVIPACPESFPPQRKDSGQAGMTLGLYFSITIRYQQQLI